jgi:hypothetical protein
LRPIEEQGYVIVAINSESVNYVDCARQLSQSLKAYVPDARVCLITDQPIQDTWFDHVRVLPAVLDNPYANDAQIFKLSPFRETVKLEADMLIASDISHWWTMFRHRDVVISTGCRNWRGDVSTARNYRKVFDDNHLPDVYNAITYWRLSSTAKEFFGLVRNIFANWVEFRRLIKFAPEVADTDLVYAIAAQIIGPEQVTMPFADYPQIVHMKRHHAGTETERWTQELVWETDPLRINTIAQWGAFHYNIKDWQP